MVNRGSVAVLLVIGAVFAVGWAVSGSRPVDASVYWAADLDNLYGPWGRHAYVYPPPLAMGMALIRPLGWPLVIGLWTFALFAATAYAGRVWALALVLVSLALLPSVGFDQPLRFELMWPMIGNVGAALPALVILGLRWPAVWSLVVMTKVMPGIGMLWFAFRGEWRSFAIATGATVALFAVTFAIRPDLWLGFFHFALTNGEANSPLPVVPVPWALRVAMSVALLWWGARTDRAWVVPLACGWASQGLYEWSWVIWIPAALVLASPRYIWNSMTMPFGPDEPVPPPAPPPLPEPAVPAVPPGAVAVPDQPVRSA